MAGRGFPPKDPEKLAGHSHGKAANPTPTTTIPFVPGKQPELPRLVVRDPVTGLVHQKQWHEQTVEWWAMWGRAAQSDSFTESDWSVLLETARLHDQFWNGDMKVAPELRLRVAKFGATPEDRARLRMFFADADEKDQKRGTSSTPPAPASPYGGLRAVPTQ